MKRQLYTYDTIWYADEETDLMPHLPLERTEIKDFDELYRLYNDGNDNMIEHIYPLKIWCEEVVTPFII